LVRAGVAPGDHFCDGVAALLPPTAVALAIRPAWTEVAVLAWAELLSSVGVIAVLDGGAC
jgi:hypothetical protein